VQRTGSAVPRPRVDRHPRMRVLFSAVGAVGHIYPMVPLARALLAAGHEVRWASSAEMCPTIAQAGIPAVSAGLSSADWREQRNRRIGELADFSPEERTDRLAAWMFGEMLAPAMLHDLLAIVRSWPPGLFVHDSMEFAAPIAADTIGAVHIAHSFGPLTPEYRILDIAASVSPLWATADMDSARYGGMYDHLYLDIYPPSIQPTISGHLRRCQAVRPVAYAPGMDEAPAVLADDTRPLIYATFGTELPDQRPLKTVVDAISSLDVRVLATIGRRGNPSAFGHQPENVPSHDTYRRPRCCPMPPPSSPTQDRARYSPLWRPVSLSCACPTSQTSRSTPQPLPTVASASALTRTYSINTRSKRQSADCSPMGRSVRGPWHSGTRSHRCPRLKMSSLSCRSLFTPSPLAAAEPGARGEQTVYRAAAP
jgi:hypothetical protein